MFLSVQSEFEDGGVAKDGGEVSHRSPFSGQNCASAFRASTDRSLPVR